MHETFESDLSAEMSRVNQLESLSQELESLNYSNTDAVQARLQSIKDAFTNLQALANGRRERIQNGIAAQQKLDSIRLEYAKLAAVCVSLSLSLCFSSLLQVPFAMRYSLLDVLLLLLLLLLFSFPSLLKI